GKTRFVEEAPMRRQGGVANMQHLAPPCPNRHGRMLTPIACTLSSDLEQPLVDHDRRPPAEHIEIDPHPPLARRPLDHGLKRRERSFRHPHRYARPERRGFGMFLGRVPLPASSAALIAATAAGETAIEPSALPRICT